jgi:hypothetical protein
VRHVSFALRNPARRRHIRTPGVLKTCKDAIFTAKPHADSIPRRSVKAAAAVRYDPRLSRLFLRGADRRLPG